MGTIRRCDLIVCLHVTLLAIMAIMDSKTVNLPQLNAFLYKNCHGHVSKTGFLCVVSGNVKRHKLWKVVQKPLKTQRIPHDRGHR